jgi:hypothetical protein
MSEPRFIKFVKGRYWVTLTKTAEHPISSYHFLLVSVEVSL